MRIHHLRNATMVIESGSCHILVDPMLSDIGRLPPFAYLRHKPLRNPTVPLPAVAERILRKVTHCLLTHSQKCGRKALQHTDHLDEAGAAFLRARRIPVVCPDQDAANLRKIGLRVAVALPYWRSAALCGGAIAAVPAQHGRGWIYRLMANGAGFFLALPGEPTLYIAGDTVWTKAVQGVLQMLKPDVAVVAAGTAQLDVGGPILMPLEEVAAFVRNAPGRVIANHLEALNHCPTTRARLKRRLADEGLRDKTSIPDDGETLTIDA